jgi:hypothetical protein
MADRADWEHVTQHTRHMAVAADAELRRRHPDQRIDPLRSGEPAHRGDWARAAGMRSPTQLGLGSASSCGPSPLWGHSRWPSSAGAESMHRYRFSRIASGRGYLSSLLRALHHRRGSALVGPLHE